MQNQMVLLITQEMSCEPGSQEIGILGSDCLGRIYECEGCPKSR